ncbi:Long-chain-fatty-acid--CoA ligase [Paraburkholderia nemoris]|uniref:long-chain-fatty-acid--CoA ligase n=1 Tax=Paraburkholderia nemoris TaxID=2793076 RepID=UPI00190B92CC|nr:long-chain-fatty-acid--CoA ligase [Paraburkholderia nemoris]MBK3739306.1 long-chain-fatty-acid--CoA ligase [Paraburkholderia aspalathi]CAE6710153.1 Long-chain-fatty-acid--CoA ligase [Paraburkholderia nemoris]
MEKIWLKSYPPGVPAEIDTTQFSSVGDLLEQSFLAHAAERAFVCMGHELTYGELDAKSRHLAAWFQWLGLARGARIAVMLPNVLQYPVVMAAILRAGYVVVNVNPLYTPRELEHQLNDSGAEAIVLLEPFAKTLETVQAHTSIKHVVLTSIGEMLGAGSPEVAENVPPTSCIALNDAIARGSDSGFTPVALTQSDVAVLQYTGGTTGVSKGATLLHGNLIANVLQSELWREPVYRGRTDIKQYITVVALPLYHIFGLTVCGLLTMRCGGMGILIPNPRDLPGLIKTLRGYAINSFPGVNTMYNALLNEPDFKTLDFSKLVQSNGGGMAVQQAVAQRWQALTGVPIVEGYGLSETSPCATTNLPTSTAFTGTVGLPLPSTEISIRDDAGNDVPLGERGEICIRGPQVMAGYWNRPDETAKAMTPDGFFKSGDIGVMTEEGFVKIVDRKKDMILVSGFNVYPNEIEDVVAKHPGVFEVVAVGVPDAEAGEVVKLYVVKKDPALTDADILAFCKEQLTGYKRPKIIEFRSELPKTNVGKILRRALRDEAKSAG